jgi:hypothetical protein
MGLVKRRWLGGCVGYDEVALLKAMLGQGFGLAKSKADGEFAWKGDGLTVEVVANATWIIPRSGYSEEQGSCRYPGSFVSQGWILTC